MVYLNRCSFRTSDGMQWKKLLHPPEIHSFHSDGDSLFPTPWSAFSAADSLWQCSMLLPGCVRRIRCPAAFADPRFLANLTACTLYSLSYSLFFDIFVSSVFPFFYFIPLWLMCQVLLYRIISTLHVIGSVWQLLYTHQFRQACIVGDSGAFLEFVAGRSKLPFCFLFPEYCRRPKWQNGI